MVAREAAPQHFRSWIADFGFEMALLAGRKLGNFEVLASIDSGGMGEVYRARDTKLGREVALKFLPGEMAQDAMALERFQREARAARSEERRVGKESS